MTYKTKDLAIYILFFERPDQTIECIKGFLPSKVKIYILNNNSSDNSTKQLMSFVQKYPQIKIFSSKKNLGASGGRNYLIKNTKEKWMFFIDNDIVIDTKNWLDPALKTINKNKNLDVIIPKLYNKHEGRHALPLKIEIEKDRAIFRKTKPKEMPNAFSGGASIINRKVFENHGLYDERIFVGLEDFELTIRAIKNNKPIQTITLDDINLTHDHQIAKTNNDKKAVLKRYDLKMIQRSYNILKKTYGLNLDNDWKSWATNQVKIMSKKSKIALVCDVRNWAFDNIAKQIKNNLSDVFEIQIIYAGDYPEITRLFEKIIFSNFDLIHFFWRLLPYESLNYYNIKILDKKLCAYLSHYSQKIVTASVYDHAFLDELSINKYSSIFNQIVDAYTVSSKKLNYIYSNLPNIKAPTMTIQDGVDLKLFYPKNIKRFNNNHHETLRIGWVGNSKWSIKKGDDIKGVQTVINPSLKYLSNKGLNITPFFADRNYKHIPLNKMVDYYSQIDILVCASSCEGTPNPILEAMACGVPIISTDVGIVPEIMGPKQKKFIIRRSIKDLSEKIKFLCDNRHYLEILSKENRQYIKRFTRKKESEKWQKFFNQALSQQSKDQKQEKLIQINNVLLQSGISYCDNLNRKIRFKRTFLKKIEIGLFVQKV